MSDNLINVQPSFWHVTSSVNNIKSSNALKNAKAIVDMYGLRTLLNFGGGCNDNAHDVHKEIRETYKAIVKLIDG